MICYFTTNLVGPYYHLNAIITSCILQESDFRIYEQSICYGVQVVGQRLRYDLVYFGFDNFEVPGFPYYRPNAMTTKS